MSRPKNSFEPYSDPKNSQLGPQKVENDPKIKSKSKVRIEENLKIKDVHLHKYNPKQFLNPTLTPKIAH